MLLPSARRPSCASLLLACLILLASSRVTFAQLPGSPPAGGRVGVLLLAHGGQPAWDAEVRKVAGVVAERYPTEVAFGMATRRTIQQGVDRLQARGVGEIVAVPLFVSSHSSVVASTAFLLGLRTDAPADLAIFATMDHGAGSDLESHAGHHDQAAPPADPASPVRRTVPIRMTPALDADPVVADILRDRAMSISRDPSREVVVLVAHGPGPDDENALWLANMGQLADRMRRETRFVRIDALTVRDDADEPVKAAATAELRAVVSRGLSAGHRVLVVPLLLSYGGIEAGLRTRLEGLDVTMSPQALLPDDRIAGWVLTSVNRASAAR